jgi:hypothetical protein
LWGEKMCDDLPRPDWPIDRRIAMAALLEISTAEPDELACGDESDGVTAETARMRILNNDWQKYDDHEEFLKEFDRLCQ